MRIGIVNEHRELCGGVESYLSQLLPALQNRGFDVAFWHADRAIPDRPQISIPSLVPVWSVDEMGEEAALDALAEWRPDVIYAHGLRSPSLERRTQQIAPAVFFAHAYYGSCISGRKTFSRPNLKSCDKRFGWQCLLHYYVRRCGGLNPCTMMKDHRRQADRLNFLADYQAIVVASDHMANEYRKYGLSSQVKVVGLPVCPPKVQAFRKKMPSSNREWRLIFLGRMEALKGGLEFLEALPRAQSELQSAVHVTFAGDGPKREEWQRRANQLSISHPGLKFDFPGWVSEKERSALLQKSDLIVIPSLWPEPFGLVGLEAAHFGVPAVAFATGGICSWLKNEVNGMLVTPRQPYETGLAWAIVRCLRDQRFHLSLVRGALEQVRSFSMDAHLVKLLPELDGVLHTAHIQS